MAESTFLYVTYIRTTPEKLWEALTSAEFNRTYWVGCWQESTWEAGATWKLFLPDGRLGDAGHVVEVDKPRRLVLEWRNEFMPELKEEGYSRCIFELEPNDEIVRLTITHSISREGSKFIQAVSNGWPKILASLKSLLETGEPLAAANKWPKGL